MHWSRSGRIIVALIATLSVVVLLSFLIGAIFGWIGGSLWPEPGTQDRARLATGWGYMTAKTMLVIVPPFLIVIGLPLYAVSLRYGAVMLRHYVLAGLGIGAVIALAVSLMTGIAHLVFLFVPLFLCTGASSAAVFLADCATLPVGRRAYSLNVRFPPKADVRFVLEQ